MQAIHWNTLGAQALKDLDRSRRARGELLERAGYGPQPTPSVVIHAEPGLNLRRYGPAAADGPPVLLVPAPIKRAYIWDLAPATSVVRRWLERGYTVYLAEWAPLPDPGTDTEHGWGLDDYGNRLLSACRAAIVADGRRARPVLAGHSLGGVLAAIHACAHPDALQAVILLEAPLHVDPRACCFNRLIEAAPPAGDIAAAFGQVPGAFLNLVSALAEPHAFQLERWIDRCLALTDPQALATHMRVERWTHDEFALPGRLFTDIVDQLYRGDALMRGALPVGGGAVGPRALRAPLACVVDPRSKVIPLDAVEPFYNAAASARKLLLHYTGDIGVNLQHVGVLVGRSAHARIWPALFDWLDGADVAGQARSVN